VWHGYARLATGTITSFDVPGSVGTFAEGIDGGSIAGFYEDTDSAFHGFYRTNP
jgi:hypothetical protein